MSQEPSIDTKGVLVVPVKGMEVLHWRQPRTNERRRQGKWRIDPKQPCRWFPVLGLATFYDNEKVSIIADLVVQYQTVASDGIKPLQVGFYVVATTEFIQFLDNQPYVVWCC